MDKYVQIWMKKGLSGWGKKHSFAFKFAVLSTFDTINPLLITKIYYKHETIPFFITSSYY